MSTDHERLRQRVKEIIETCMATRGWNPHEISDAAMVAALEGQGNLSEEVTLEIGVYAATAYVRMNLLSLIFEGEAVPFLRNGELAVKHPKFNKPSPQHEG